MNERENTLRAIRFEHPDHIPMAFHINDACWHHYDQAQLQDLMEFHRFLFPDFVRRERVEPAYALNQRAGEPYTDYWHCTWYTEDDGITGTVRDHPLEDLSLIDSFEPPDPEVTNGTYPLDWAAVIARVEEAKEADRLITGGLPHGHTFLRLIDIMGYENLLFSMADEDPALATLMEMVTDFNRHIVLRWLALDPDMMSYPEDLGMQTGPMLSPAYFSRYIQPVYTELMKPARQQGCIIHMHSDGDIRSLVDSLIEGGVDVINVQDLVNGISWLQERFAGRTAIDLDIDRQRITPRGTPEQIDALIRSEVEALGSREGGLMMVYGLYPGVPPRNVEALMDAMERYAGYYA